MFHNNKTKPNTDGIINKLPDRSGQVVMVFAFAPALLTDL